MKFRSIAISFAVLTMVGCKNIFEDNDVSLDGSTPYNSIDSPKNNNVYKTTNAIAIKSGFSDKDKVELVDVKLVALGSELRGSTNVISFQKFPNMEVFSLDTTFAAGTLAAGKYQLQIRSVDTRKNEGVKEVLFTIN